MHSGVKLLEYVMIIVEKVLWKRLKLIVEIDNMQFEFIPGIGTIYAILTEATRI